MRRLVSLLTACIVSLLLMGAIPMLHYVYAGGSNRGASEALSPRRVELFARKQKKRKEVKVIKRIKQKRMERSRRQAPSRFQMDLSVSGPEDAVAIERTELRVEAYEMGETDTPVRPKRQIRPRMPIRARDEEVEGVAVIRFLVDERGIVVHARIVKENPMGYGFGANGLEAVRQTTFEPAKLRGVPVKQWVNQEFEYVLQ